MARRPLVLVTRPSGEAGRTAAALAEAGFDALVEPLLTIEPLADAPARLGDLAGVAALAFTSVNGIEAFAAACPRRDLPVYAVGPATAAAARAAGFPSVDTAGGDVEALVRLIQGRHPADRGLVLHAAGESVAGDLAGRLTGLGYRVRREALYRARTADRLSASARDTLLAGRLDAVLLFSPRTAQTFVTLVRTEQAEDACRRVVAACLSPAVAEAVAAIAWAKVAVATEPTQAAAIAALGATVQRQDPTGFDSRERPTMAEDDAKTPTDKGPEPAPEPQGAPAIDIGAAEVVQRFGGIRPMASKMGISFSTVQGWKERNQIPANRHAEIVALAEKLNVSLAPGEPAPPAAAETLTAPTPASAPAPEPPQTFKLPPIDKAADDPPPASPRLPPQPMPAERAGLGLGGVVLVSAVVVAIAAAGAYVARPYWLAAPTGAPVAASGDTGELVARLAKLERDLAARPATPAPAAVDPKLAQDIAALSKRLGEVDAAIAAAKRDAAQASEQAAGIARDAQKRTEALEKGFDPQGFVALRTGLNDLNQKIAALNGRLDTAEKATSAARAQGLADAALTMAVAQLRRAVDGGSVYSPELAAVRAVSADAKLQATLDALAPAAQAGVASRAALADEFPAVANAIAQASLRRGGEGWWRAVTDRLDGLVSIRPVGAAVAGDHPRAKAARAEAAAARGDLAGAVTALNGLEGKPAEAAKPWLDRAKARIAADQALAALESQATASLTAKPK
ncbi:MAG: uroporphyrinogen-III synthase [Rhodospirillales bacterium]|nr:uroporphyrinogen-III synthase [Rhodospirillales bacterium]